MLEQPAMTMLSSEPASLPEALALQQRVALLERQTRELTTLHTVATAISHFVDLDELLSHALSTVLSAIPIPELRPMGAIFLINDETGAMRLVTQQGLDASITEHRGCARLGECLCGLVGMSGQTLTTTNSARDRRHSPRCTAQRPFGHIVAPIQAHGRTLGVLSLYLEPDIAPDPAYVRLVTVIGQQLGLAVAQSQLYHRLQSTVTKLQQTSGELAERNAQLERSNRELRITYELAMAMQSSADLGDVQDRLLSLITGDLGYERAILAMVDSYAMALSGWVCSTNTPGAHLQRIPHTTRLIFEQSEGPLAEALRSGQPQAVADGRPPTSDPQFNEWLALGSYVILPIVLRQQVLGVLIVDAPYGGRSMSEEDLTLLANLGRQASVVLGGVQLCIDRAQHLAIEEERSRIAMEIHDSVAQQLYGLTYTIDACVDLLPEHPALVREQLLQLMPHARQANLTLRRAIFDLWPEELDHERFAVELRGYLESIAPTTALQLHIQVDHAYDLLPMALRRQLYRIAQEALNNVVKHAEARRAKLTVVVNGKSVRMRIADDGCGFAIDEGLPTQAGAAHYGLTSMRERAEAFDGQLMLDSAPGQGTIITVSLPLHHG